MEITFNLNAKFQSNKDCPHNMKIKKVMKKSIYKSLRENEKVIRVGSWICLLCPFNSKKIINNNKIICSYGTKKSNNR